MAQGLVSLNSRQESRRRSGPLDTLHELSEKLAGTKLGRLPRISTSRNTGGLKFGGSVRYCHMHTGMQELIADINLAVVVANTSTKLIPCQRFRLYETRVVPWLWPPSGRYRQEYMMYSWYRIVVLLPILQVYHLYWLGHNGTKRSLFYFAYSVC